jgi:hypothetical protein
MIQTFGVMNTRQEYADRQFSGDAGTPNRQSPE